MSKMMYNRSPKQTFDKIITYITLRNQGDYKHKNTW